MICNLGRRFLPKTPSQIIRFIRTTSQVNLEVCSLGSRRHNRGCASMLRLAGVLSGWRRRDGGSTHKTGIAS